MFSALVAECPYADLREIAVYRLRPMLAMPLAKLVVGSGMLYANLVDGLKLQQVSPVSVIANVSAPILLIHGLNDTQTPPSNSEQLAKADPRAQLWLVPNAPHVGVSGIAPEEFRRRVLTWFADH